MLVSFIIPAYNAADTIERCLESIYGLSLKREEFEVIVIDDCSTDNAVAVLEEWNLKNEDCSIVILRQPENHRQGAARNRGLKVAKGEYICFVDADDAVAEGIVTAIRKANEKKMDLLAFHTALADENGQITREEEHLQYGPDEVFTGLDMQHPYWCSAPWGYIYSKEFLKRVDYPFAEDVLYEDADFVSAHVYYAQRMAYSPELGYIAYYRSGSTTRSMTYKNMSDFLMLGVRMLRLYDRIKVEHGQNMKKDEEIFADSILDGACRNMWAPAKRIIRLENTNELRAFYERVDQMVDRHELVEDKRLRTYYWNAWTTIVLNHKQLTIAILSIAIPIYKELRKLKNVN